MFMPKHGPKMGQPNCLTEHAESTCYIWLIRRENKTLKEFLHTAQGQLCATKLRHKVNAPEESAGEFCLYADYVDLLF